MKRILVMVILLAVCLLCANALAAGEAAYGATRAEILSNIGYDASKIYKVGSEGEVVRFIQTALSESGYYNGEITGQYDEATEEAVSDILLDTGFYYERGQCDRLRMYRIVELYLDQYDDPDEHADWNDILDALGQDGSYAFGKTTAKLENGKITVSGGTVMDVTAFLKYSEPKANGNNTVVYNVHLIDQNGEALELPGECILCFPYPEGLDENSKNKYRMIIHHYADNGGTEIFKSEDGDIDFTKQGICIRISSFSPFEITWEEMEEANLPQTGDHSCLALWIMLLCMSGAAVLLRRRAHN